MTFLQLFFRFVSTGCAHVWLGFEPLGVKSSGRMAQGGSGTPDGLRPAVGSTTAAVQQQGNEFDDGRHWRLSQKTAARIADGRPAATDSTILHDIRSLRGRGRYRGRRSPSRHAVGQSGFRPHSASGRRHIHRKLPTHRVSCHLRHSSTRGGILTNLI